VPGLLRPDDLKQMYTNAEKARMDEARLYDKKKQEQDLKLREEFMSREIHQDVIDRINGAISRAAKNRLHRVEIITFPCSYCNDRGRTINIADPDWPSSLEGFAKRAYDFFMKELRPLGYKLHAEIVSFRDGIPSEAALILTW
jgi:hypothetical protein